MVSLEQLGYEPFVDGNVTAFEGSNFLFITIDADHIMANFC